MANRSYKIGQRFEYRVRDFLKRLGYQVLRSPRSSGPYDLMAVGAGNVLLVQCKVDGVIGPSEWNELYDVAESVRGLKCLPVVVLRQKRKLVWRQIVAKKDGTHRRQPWVGVFLFGNDPVRAV